MRDSMDIHDSNAFEVAPLIPDPPIKRKRRFRRSFLHRCWNVFSSCSRWTCIFASLAVVVLIIILCRTLLPFGWPSWIPSLNYDATDPHIIVIMADDLGWNDVGYSQLLLFNNDVDTGDTSDADDTSESSSENSKYNEKYFTEFSKLLKLERNKRVSSKSETEENDPSEEEEEESELYNDGESFRTPNIDSLAKAGIILDRFYVSQEGSSNRASVLSGKHGFSMGLQNGIETGSNGHIPTSVQLVSEILSEQRGYSTHLIGKWNLGYSRWVYTPIKRGFDTFLGFHQQWLDYWHYTTSDDTGDYENHVGWDLWRDMREFDLALADRKFSTELFTNEVVSIIEGHANGDSPDQPMFLMFTAPNPHTPLDYHSKFSDSCSNMEETLREKYCNLVQSLDMSIGAIVGSLRENDMYDRSVIMVVSDNGGMICYDVGDSNKCSAASNYPLRAGKGTLFEGGVRTRAFISGGMIPESRQGSVYTHPFMHVDLFPTILSGAGIDSSDISSYEQDGIAHFDYLFDDDESFRPRTDGILDVLKDDDGNLIRGAYIQFPFKYIIQMEEAYDGWYTTPFDGGDAIPDDAQASKGVYATQNAGVVSMVDNFEDYYESKALNSNSGNSDENGIASEFDNVAETSVGKTKKLYFGNIDKSADDTELISMSYNEYLFDLNSDAKEEHNLFSSMDGKANELRNLLIDVMSSEQYRTPQDSTSNDNSDPADFDNIWYPFEEKKKN